ncbi:PBP1A family penicillin-binding protein [Paenalcaligenes sp.]|uniref:penicillin-binding protein 1A n=1 Tax=Paenalcaligenes sp. TaxID=1966342 RepID=UPI00262C9E2D|nr:PBP1A family penicillin-binding protein [Paenalcaligenes sp.]
MSSTDSSTHTTAPASGSWLIRLILKTAIFFTGLAACGALVVALALALAWPNLPDLSAMTDYKPRVPLRIYTADKVLIGEFGEERRNVMRLDEIPDVMKSAILAAEDDRFYQHSGVDLKGIGRAVLANLASGAKSQGASTITMQVARNFYLSSEKTYTRKFYELLLTFKIESMLSKDQILELYMNQIFLGHRSYGFAAASRAYFGKPLTEITLAEAAMLAGIPRAPSRYNPIANYNEAKRQQVVVLRRMLNLGYITQDEHQAALDQAIEIRTAEGMPAGGYAIHGEYAAELARQLLYGVYKDGIYSRGFNVYTTIDSKQQEAAYRSVRDAVLQYTRRARYPGPEARVNLPANIEQDTEAFSDILAKVQREHPDAGDLLVGVVLSASPTQITVARTADNIITVDNKRALSIVARGLTKNANDKERIDRGAVVYLFNNGDYWEVINMPAVQAAFVSMRPQDGAIQAMVGGFHFSDGKFNRVTQAWRQPGSAFKPFIYAASLEKGLTPETLISDQPFSLTSAQTGSKPWNPKNYGGRYENMLTMRNGLYKSKNMVSIRIMQAVGPKYVQDYIVRFGFDRARQPAVLPLALGAGSVTPLQLATAYSVFANNGYRVQPYLIDHITDGSGKVIMRAKPVVAGDSNARAIDPRTAYVMNHMLRGVATSGTGSRASATLKRNDIGGKTGTTNNSHDAWFAGYTPDIVGIAWLGFDQPRSLGASETGGGLAMPVWIDYMKTALKDVPQKPLGPVPSGLKQIDGNFYFDEFPPGKAILRVGLPSVLDDSLYIEEGAEDSEDGIGRLLEQLERPGDALDPLTTPGLIPF